MRFIALILLAAVPVAARTRSAQFPSHERILVVVAHPDDEALLAPILAKKCVDERASCAILVLTRGENGPCALVGGCEDLGARRAAEMLAAAAALHAYVIQWTYPDVFDPEARWPATAAADIERVIATQRPDVIYTFDPNHGSSCHQAHRYTGHLVLSLPRGVPVMLIETQIIRSPGVSLAPATGAATAFDARRYWDRFIADLEAHQSQFSAADVEELRTAPEDTRRVWLMDSVILGHVAYQLTCN